MVFKVGLSFHYFGEPAQFPLRLLSVADALCPDVFCPLLPSLSSLLLPCFIADLVAACLVYARVPQFSRKVQKVVKKNAQMGRSMVPRRGLNRLVVADADDPPKIRAFGPGQNGCLARGPRQEPKRHSMCEVCLSGLGGGLFATSV